jgi:hypothetical protein
MIISRISLEEARVTGHSRETAPIGNTKVLFQPTKIKVVQGGVKDQENK